MSGKNKYILPFLLLLFLIGFTCMRATKGIDLTDEGMYVSTAMRYSLGDVPFRDEIMNTMRLFDVFVSPIFRLCPDITLVQLRLLGGGIHMLSAIILFIFLARYIPPLLSALSCGAMFLMNNFYGVLTPSYNSFPSDFSLISVILWLFAAESDKRLYRIVISILAGLFMGLAVLSYMPLFPIAMVPLAAWLLTVRKNKALAESSYIILGVFALMAVGFFTVTSATGVLKDFILAFKEATTTSELVKVGIVTKLFGLLTEFAKNVPAGIALLGALILAFFIVPTDKKKPISIRAFFGWLVLLLVMYRVFVAGQGEPGYINLKALSFAVPLALAVPFLNNISIGGQKEGSRWRIAGNILIAWGFLSAVIFGVLSDAWLRNCLLGTTPLFAAGITSLYRSGCRLVNNEPEEGLRKAVWPVMFFAVAAAFFAEGVVYNIKYIYRDYEMAKLNRRFSCPKLAGIYSTSERVKVIEDLLSYLNGKVKPGDYFLAYNYVPLLYFLTHTRPAYGAAWATDLWPLSLRERLVSTMVERGRIPEYSVRMLTLPGSYSNLDWKTPMPYDVDSPLDKYVKANYHLEKVIYPFEIWRRNVK